MESFRTITKEINFQPSKKKRGGKGSYCRKKKKKVPGGICILLRALSKGHFANLKKKEEGLMRKEGAKNFHHPELPREGKGLG